jgi:hypothetical protein
MMMMDLRLLSNTRVKICLLHIETQLIGFAELDCSAHLFCWM